MNRLLKLTQAIHLYIYSFILIAFVFNCKELECITIFKHSINPPWVVIGKPFVVGLEFRMDPTEVFDEIRFNKIVSFMEDFNIYYSKNSSNHRYPKDMGLRVNLTLSNVTHVYFNTAEPEDVGYYEWVIFARGTIYAQYKFVLPFASSHANISSHTFNPTEPRTGNPLAISVTYQLSPNNTVQAMQFNKISPSNNNVYYVKDQVNGYSNEMGKRINLKKSNSSYIYFTNIEAEDGGDYEWWIQTNKGNVSYPLRLRVSFLPFVPVTITGVQKFYKNDEILQILCHSVTPLYTSVISWIVNGEKMDSVLITNETLVYKNKTYYNTTGTLFYKLHNPQDFPILCQASFNYSFLTYDDTISIIVNPSYKIISYNTVVAIFTVLCIVSVICGIVFIIFWKKRRMQREKKKTNASSLSYERTPTTEI